MSTIPNEYKITCAECDKLQTFCPECITLIEEEDKASINICGTCGEEHHILDQICPSCGDVT